MADPRDTKFNAARKEQARRLTRIQKDTAVEIMRLLKSAAAAIKQQIALAPTPTEWQSYYLPKLQESVQQALNVAGTQASARLGTAAGQAWAAGIDLIDKPLEAALSGLNISGALASIDVRQLQAMRSFMTERMRDVSTTVANRINAEIGLVAIGARTPSQAAGAVDALIAGGRGRAITVVRTELGRAYSVATQERLAQAKALLPGLKKQWRRSGKIHSRFAHDAADGQVQPVDQPFLVGGKPIMFPRDPKAPPSETINCGCDSLPFMDGWEVSQPGRRPFTDQELAKSPSKRLLRDL